VERPVTADQHDALAEVGGHGEGLPQLRLAHRHLSARVNAELLSARREIQAEARGVLDTARAAVQDE
jgi:hypothetical protein